MASQDSSAWQEVGDRVYRRRYPFLDQNIGLVIGEGEALIVDARTTYPQAREVQAEIRAMTAVPWRILVNTHGHWDHCFGNAAYTGAMLWGQLRCPAFLARTAEAARERISQSMPEIADELRQIVVTPPRHLVDRAAIVTVGGRRVVLRHLGHGHTDHDLIVEVPDCDVVFAGDLVEEGAPPSFGDSFPLEWPETLGLLLPSLGGVVVPGHGDVVDAAFVAAQRDELAALAVVARQAGAEGEPLAEAARRGPYPVEVTLQALQRAALEMAEPAA